MFAPFTLQLVCLWPRGDFSPVGPHGLAVGPTRVCYWVECGWECLSGAGRLVWPC